MDASYVLETARRFWRRKLWLVIPTLVGVSLAYAYAKSLEPRYRASAIIAVDQQTIRRDIVQQTVTTGVSDRLRQIEQHVKQAEILEPIIRELNLYSEYLESDQIGKAIDKARDSIVFEEFRRQRTISVTFYGTKRRLVAKTANRIAGAVIAENLRLRETQTRATSSFIDERLAEVSKDLRETDDEIVRLKKRWDGRLPEQRSSNRQTLQELKRRLTTVEESIQNAETRRLLLQTAREARREAPALTPAASSELDRLKLEYRRLKSHYTEKHPDVIRLSQEIALLERSQPPTPPTAAIPEPSLERDPILAAELDGIDSELRRRRSELNTILADIARYRSRLEGVPHVEQELDRLQTQYNNYEGFYRSLLKQQIEAKLAETLEEQGQSERLSILKRAESPLEPYWPNVLLLLIVGTGLGGALGVGLVFLRDEMDQTFLDPDSLKGAFPGVTVLATIPNLNEQSNILFARPKKRVKTA